MLSIINELILEKEFRNFLKSYMWFWTKIVNTQNQNTKAKIKIPPEPGIEPITSRTTVVCVSSRSP